MSLRIRPGAFSAAAVVSVVALWAVAAAPPPEEVPTERAPRCFDCHASWTPPLVELAALDACRAPLGPEWGVSVEAAWLHELWSYALEVDLSGADGLRFADHPAPIVDHRIRGTLEVDAQGRAASSHMVQIPAAATRVALLLAPAGAVAPTFRLAVAPDTAGPEAADAVGSGPGEEVLIEASGTELSRIGTGLWRIFVEAVDVPLAASYELRLDVDVGDDDVRQAVQAGLDPGKAALARFPLATDGPKGAVTVRFTGTAYYDHRQSDDDDLATFTKERTFSIDAATGTIICPEPQAPVVRVTRSPAGIGEALGYWTGGLLLVSMTAGGVFGARARNALNGLFGTARRRVAFHNAVSWSLMLAGAAHIVLFLAEPRHPWTLGVLWGGIACLGVMGLAVTGAMQRVLVPRWGYRAWQVTHLALALVVLAASLLHLALDGSHFAPVQDAVGWRDPVARAVGR